MKPGSIVVDIYGNLCSKSVKDQEIYKNGITIIYYSDLVSRVAPQASELYANCLYNIFTDIYDGEVLTLNELDDLVGSMFVLKAGKMLWYARPPMSPITAMVQTGKIIYRLSIPTAEGKGESLWSRLDFLWTTLILLTAFMIFSFLCLEYEDWSLIMEDLLVFVLALIIGSFICENTETKYYGNFVARAGALSAICLVTVYGDWEQWFGPGDAGTVVICLVSFLVGTFLDFLVGIALKICWKEQELISSFN